VQLADIRKRVYTLVGDKESSPLYFNGDRVDRAINRAYFTVAKESHALEQRTTVNLVNNQAIYDLPSNTDRVFRAAYNEEKIFPTSTQELDRFERTWESSNHELLFYTLDLQQKDKIRFYGTPQLGTGFSFDSEWGTIVDYVGTADDQFRLESDIVSLGTVVNYTSTDNTVSFAIGTGGGSDSSHGIVVDMSDTDSTTYTLSADLGTIVDLDDESSGSYDAEEFTNGTISSRVTEYGEVTDIDDPAGTDTYLFNDEDGTPFGSFTFTQETGETIDISESTFNSEFGSVAAIEDAMFSSELGIMVAANELEVGIVIDWDSNVNALEIWSTRVPDELTSDDDEPELPGHSHLAIVYYAAERLLRNKSEVQNIELSTVYRELGDEYVFFLRTVTANRSPEQYRQIKPFRTTRTLHKQARLPATYPGRGKSRNR